MIPMRYICTPIYGEGDILILLRIPASALARQFLVCTISCELVVGFLPNFINI